MRQPIRLAQELGKAFKLPALGASWPGPGPFLYVRFHRDYYPRGNGKLAPDPKLLEGRVLGNDFKDKDGWNMYMGNEVPGFPSHPHRGMETVTIVREGTIDHGDSTKSGARYSVGDVQWVTAGKGVVHSEMFPLLNTDKENTHDLYQLWLNMARVNKDADPEFVMMWQEAIPHIQKDGVVVQVIAGDYFGHKPLQSPKASWAARESSDVAIWFIDMAPGSSVSLPPTNTDKTERTVYVHACVPGPHGPEMTEDPVTVKVGEEWVPDWHGISLPPNQGEVKLENSKNGTARVLVLQSVPIENIDAFAVYRKTKFGGWPWPSDRPTYGDSPRFAQYRGGPREEPGKKFGKA